MMHIILFIYREKFGNLSHFIIIENLLMSNFMSVNFFLKLIPFEINAQTINRNFYPHFHVIFVLFNNYPVPLSLLM